MHPDCSNDYFGWTDSQRNALKIGDSVVCHWTDLGPQREIVVQIDALGVVFEDATESEWYQLDPNTVESAK